MIPAAQYGGQGGAALDAVSNAEAKTRALIADLWRRNRPVIEERLGLLDRAACAEPMSEDLRRSALDVAHKLSGSLGMFGFDQGTAMARELEQLLDSSAVDARRIAILADQLRKMLLPSS